MADSWGHRHTIHSMNVAFTVATSGSKSGAALRSCQDAANAYRTTSEQNTAIVSDIVSDDCTYDLVESLPFSMRDEKNCVRPL